MPYPFKTKEQDHKISSFLRTHIHCGMLVLCVDDYPRLVCSGCIPDFVVSKFFSPVQDLCNICDFGWISHTFSNLV